MNDTTSSGVRFGRIAAMIPVRDMARPHDFSAGVLGFTKTFGSRVGFTAIRIDVGQPLKR